MPRLCAFGCRQLSGMLESSNNDTEAGHNPEQASLLQLPQTGMLESSNNDTEAGHNPEQASLLQLPQTGMLESSNNDTEAGHNPEQASLLQLPQTVKGPTLQQVWCEHNYSAASNYRRHSINRKLSSSL
ncbi:unnamed protein product [Diatraea saccharalis]|uniref:Uncharacterized protein n=1 Tax=Diatraea saccharalis TaxID=40085 RepID=A0A9N9WGC0_9NEOP|nr:unnamed protein product [Diatraea saccharalis]CAG9791710.1 unnamed protein product [Diatraea saccharalis]CAG9792134.1 unnamed protein product [Diatraea saccharalis]